MINYNQDGSGTITVGTAVIAFSAGIQPADLLAMEAAFTASNAAPAAPQPINVTVQAPPVTVNAPDVTALTNNVAQIAAYLPQLQSAVAKIPGASIIPLPPVLS